MTVSVCCMDHPDGCPVPDPGFGFFVSVKSGNRSGILAGPYDSHPVALAAVDAVRDMAVKHDSYAWFYAFGTAKAPLTTRAFFGLVVPV